ncbi:bifunctional riboflavin kinase/FAD synthetase [Bartonella tamiae]|uniref:Riboflavin biosynthesis protein n=1 Tax=Bartonella tamiae Th239 TaxID=1094558 RepID=J1K011_9HYPH|nr:bifunctional riboflavin kinase/FAD synthetase [Bartonella tamiae]EJF90345.1 riboflavin biosynthesis protein RibF [Bartonella tamiae Th239]EJF93714.1 riboflavin biosynthesis protein RibF [Bartonella tamiae Th307]
MTSHFLRLNDLALLPKDYHCGVIAIGNFDGVHRGHQAVLKRAVSFAREKNCPTLVYTFEPHPRSFFQPQKPVDRLTNAQEKAEIFKLLGFDGVVEQTFNAEFANLTADDFINTVIKNGFSAQTVVTGSDFHFGRKRSGNPDYLKNSGQENHFDVISIAPFCDDNGGVISSSRIRHDLSRGAVDEANSLLGYRYTVTSEIIHGRKLGRSLGFPTANMALPHETSLAFGVYAVRFRRSDGSLYNGVASFGKRPTVESDGQPLLETFIFDFDDTIYGEVASVSFYAFLRQELKFGGLEPLLNQMNKDKSDAKKILKNVQPLSVLDKNFTFSILKK